MGAMQAEQIGEKPRAEKKRVHYCLPLIERLGHMIEEPYFLRYLFNPNEYDVIVFTPPLAKKPRTNRVAYNIALRPFTAVEIDDEKSVNVVYEPGGNVGVVEQNGDTWVMLNGSELRRLWIKTWLERDLTLHHELNAEEKQAGLKLREQMGIPQDAPIVTLHVREPGYLPEFQYHSYRDAHIQNYLPAVQYLLDQGFYVVRLGDTSMTPLGGLHPRLIDLPFHPAYSQLAEPYFVSQAMFHVGSISGPYHIARTFHVPTLVANAPIFADDFGHTHDLFLPKTYFSTRFGRNLGYQEVLLSPLTMCCRTEHYTAAGVELRENTSGEILAAVREMHARLEKRYMAESDIAAVNGRIKNVHEMAHLWRGQKQMTPDFHAMFWSKMQISHEYIKAHSEFLGHSWE